MGTVQLLIKHTLWQFPSPGGCFHAGMLACIRGKRCNTAADFISNPIRINNVPFTTGQFLYKCTGRFLVAHNT